jgi:hypothetical protein
MEQNNQTGQTQNNQSCCPEKVTGLIQNTRTSFNENDRDWLSGLTNEQLEKLEPQDNSNEENDPKEDAKKALQDYSADNPEDVLELLPKAIADQLRSGLQLHRNHRNELIERITNNSQEFFAEELNAMETGMLEKISKSIQPSTNYSAMGAGKETQNNAGGDEDDVEPLMPAGFKENE